MFLVAALVLALAVVVFEPFKRVPEIGRGLPSRDHAATEELRARVRALFPTPIAATHIITELEAQGFAIDSDNNVASFWKNGFPCRTIWRIFWEMDDDGTVSSIDALYGGVCL
ncbi:hypothetical protein [uncultured Roseobacter sp.]|uniref:hypothetical protein n=1 Tax=uncultured Roseobacter sp. TaxID=114847 RepID=UPI002637C1C0|nr:hypothetical protein [uncultured Roseobacter sp.]